MPAPQRPCWSCIHRRELPGDAHILCAKAAGRDADKGTLVGWLAKRSGVTGDVEPDSTFHPERRIWPGSGVWPFSYDANTVVSCPAHEQKPET